MAESGFQIDFRDVSRTMEVLKSDVSMLRHSLSSSLAHQISDKMAEEYQYVIDRFYGEYTPEHYKRHSVRGMAPGLTKTFKKYYKNPHNTIYYGGIEISNEWMYKDYHDPNEEVLDSFLSGYHGRQSAGIKSSIIPYQYMLDVREDLIKQLGRSNSDLFLNAKKAAKSLPYQLIKII